MVALKRTTLDLVHITLDIAEMGISLLRPKTGSYPPIPPMMPLDVPPVPQEPEPQQPDPVRLQYGLKLPNGNIVWDSCLYQGRPLATPEQREVLLGCLRKTAEELAWPEDLFLSHYGWARRMGMPSMAYGDPTLVSLTGEPEQCSGEPEVPGAQDDERPLPT